MIRRIFKTNRLKKINSFVEADEIFLDSKNIQNFNTQQFEGRIEKPISSRSFLFITFFLFTLIIFCILRLEFLQIQKGESYLKRSENNSLDKEILFADRGIIYDRNKKELAWNTKIENSDFVYFRSYKSPGFSHVLGYVNYPAKDKTGNYWRENFIGKDGLEKVHDVFLQGQNGVKLVEKDVYGTIHSENIVNIPMRGGELITSIDERLQTIFFNSIKDLAIKSSFNGGAGIMMDLNNGEILVSTSYPEYDSEIISQGKDKQKIAMYITDKKKYLMDRTISGLYTPGSIVKPFFALGALNEKIIDPYKQIFSAGSISIPNPYFPDQPTIFKDWKAHGFTDMREAIAVSSDVYFYAIGGGYKDQKGLGISNIEKYAKLFKIGEKTGVDIGDEVDGTIPNPEWKAKVFKGDIWRLGDTYRTVIGQYGFQVTPIQMARAVSALGNNGILVSPHFILGDKIFEDKKEKINIDASLFKIIQEGMRQTVTEGTAKSLNVPYVKVAAKTGTAQLGILKNRVNAWVVGFFPYENPKYAFAILMESGPVVGEIGASYAMRLILDGMYQNASEYFQ